MYPIYTQFCWLFFFTSVGAWRIFLTAIGFLFWWCRHFTINLDNVRLLQASCRMETAQSGPWKHHQTEKLWRFLYSTPSVPRLPWVPAMIGWYQTNKKKVNIGMCPMVSNNGVQGCPRHKKSLRWERRIWKQKTHLMQNVYFCVFQWGPFQIYKEVDKCDVVLRCSVEPRLPVFKLQNYFALYSTDRTRLSPGRRHARIEVNNHHLSCKAAEMPHINTHY